MPYRLVMADDPGRRKMLKELAETTSMVNVYVREEDVINPRHIHVQKNLNQIVHCISWPYIDHKIDLSLVYPRAYEAIKTWNPLLDLYKCTVILCQWVPPWLHVLTGSSQGFISFSDSMYYYCLVFCC